MANAIDQLTDRVLVLGRLTIVRRAITAVAVTISAVLQTFLIQAFIRPADLLPSGLTGVAVLLDRVTSLGGVHIDISLGMLALNIPVALLCWSGISKRFVIFSMMQVMLSSLFLNIFHFAPFLGDKIMLIIFGGVVSGLGAAIALKSGASTGGTDIVALILAKYTSMEIGKALMASDILIVLAAAWRFGMGTGLYCILGLIGKSFVVDGAIENIRLRKVCTIMTSNPQPILDFIIKEMNRSATVEKAYGAYTHHELSVLVTVLTRRQALQLRNFLRENDPHSFITIVNSSEIIGKGFRSFN